jgi:diguanylate cyclase (GGDEF)-like protein/PAS domain S-box-containing protein
MRILIAEDEAISRRMLESTLTKWGYEVVVAADGAEAWSVLQNEDAPALAILDVMMPGIDGIEVCRNLRQMPQHVPVYVILLTAKSAQENIVAGLEAGADDYIAKPFHSDELRARIEVGTRVLKLQRSLADRVVELNAALAERERAEKSLRESERRYRHLVENSQGLICTHDLDGLLLSVNPAAARILDYDPAEMIGRSLSEFMPPSQGRLFDVYLKRIKQQPMDSGLMKVIGKSGQEFIWQYHNVQYEQDRETRYVLGHAQDVTALKHAEEAMRSLSLEDELTGLYNRRGFLLMAEQYLKTVQRSRESLTLVYADMDGLKQINDIHGHQEGSQAIQRVAAILRETLRESDVVGRLGGDEFAMLAQNVTGDYMESINARLEESLRDYNAQGRHSYELSLSLGIMSVEPDTTATVEELIAQADQLMYEHKRKKKQDRFSGKHFEPHNTKKHRTTSTLQNLALPAKSEGLDSVAIAPGQ